MTYRFPDTLCLLPLLGALVVGGCAPRPAGPAPAERWVVYLLDSTGSNGLFQDACAQAAREVRLSADPGDTWFFRYLHAESYRDSAEICTLRCPPVKVSGNVLARRQRMAAASAAAEERESVARQLEKLEPATVPGTDVYGALAKAGELLAEAPAEARKFLVLASDLGDTLERPAEVNLSGVKVIVTKFQSGEEPAKAAARRRHWKERLGGYDAEAVTFIDPSDSRPLLDR